MFDRHPMIALRRCWLRLGHIPQFDKAVQQITTERVGCNIHPMPSDAGEPSSVETDQINLWGDRVGMIHDYVATRDLYDTLVEIRFKLLTFVPTITGIAVGIVSLDSNKVDESPRLMIGLVGFVASIALVIYEIRNSQIHDRSIHRLAHLEKILGFGPSGPSRAPSGMFSERGAGGNLFGVFQVKHDRALIMIYAAVTIAWTWVIVTGAEVAADWPGNGGRWVATVEIVLPLAAGLAIAEEIARLGGRGREPRLVYFLADAKSSGQDHSGNAQEEGRAIWTQLVGVHATASSRRSVFELIQIEDHNAGNGKAIVQLAFASGIISDRQVWWFWLWCGGPSRRKDCRNRRLTVSANEVRVPADAIRHSVVGAEEVYLAMEADLGATQLVARNLMTERYGRLAPWASRMEIDLRIGLLSAASAQTDPLKACP